VISTQKKIQICWEKAPIYKLLFQRDTKIDK